MLHLAASKNDHTLAVFVVRLVVMVFALRMLGFVAAFTVMAAVACHCRATQCECQHYSKD